MAEDPYAGREATFVKHFVLRNYLNALAFKLGQSKAATTINYIDGFSGPWNECTQDSTDTSPDLAMSALEIARRKLAEKNIEIVPRCLFVEKDAKAFGKLSGIIEKHPDVIARCIHGEFEHAIPEAARFAREGRNPFAFLFIDPCGWTGFGMRNLEPLLRVQRCEVLVNLMMKDILRFIDYPSAENRDTFADLFGTEEPLDSWKLLHGRDKEDAIVAAYCQRLRDVGRFDYVGSTIVLHPLVSKTHFHLIYASRNVKGLVTFRDTERTASKVYHQVRSDARAGHDGLLFASTDLFPDPIAELGNRYHRAARDAARRFLERKRHCLYDQLIGVALAHPFTGKSDLNGWLTDWQKQGWIDIPTLKGPKRTPAEGHGHRVSLKGA